MSNILSRALSFQPFTRVWAITLNSERSCTTHGWMGGPLVELVHDIHGMLLKRLKSTSLKMQGHLYSMSGVLALPNL